MIVHLHGGGIRTLIFDRFNLLYILNKFFLKRLGGVVVLGESLVSIFAGMVKNDKMHIVPNFAEEHLYVDEKDIVKKFKNVKSLNIVFLSNLIEGKGHYELVDAFKQLGSDLKDKIRIDFAGGFESKSEKERFLDKISGIRQLCYRGIVLGGEKKRLLSNAHIFCFPTYYRYEGQPIAILESYASGCAVITTNHGGICDIFKDGINGFEVQKKSAKSIKEKIEQIMRDPGKLLTIAVTNHRIACSKYKVITYCESLIALINAVKKVNP
jgi:glycosyltransferase involved in cell wall biosynthesis